MKKLIMENLPIIGAAVICIFVIVLAAIGTQRPVPIDTMKDATKQAETLVLEQKDREISELKERVNALQVELEASQARYEDLKTRIKQKAQEAKTIRAPKDVNETKDRFRNLGYHPID